MPIAAPTCRSISPIAQAIARRSSAGESLRLTFRIKLVIIRDVRAGKTVGRLHLAAVSVTDDDLLLLRRIYSEL
jgi:hypothetical protein